jgi:uncharacterized protein YfkK (UPF0435 family)
MSDEYSTVAVRLSSKKKERWEEYVDESSEPSLSQLIRVATEKEISRENPLESPTQNASQEPSPEVMQKLEGITNKLQSVDRRLSAIESDRYGDEDLTELATSVYKILPSSIAEIQQAVAQKERADPVNESSTNANFMLEIFDDEEQNSNPETRDITQSTRRPCTGSIDDIATILDADQEAVQLAINRLQSTTHSVYSSESAAGTIHYYKED